MQKIEHKIDLLFKKIKHFKITTPTAIILGAFIISLGIVCYGFIKPSNINPLILQPNFSGKSLSEEKYIDGVNKKVFFVEYSDTECPWCVHFYPTFEKIQKEYSDKIGIVYRHFNGRPEHTNAQKEAEAIECAGSLGGKDKYFAYIKTLFDYKNKNQIASLPILLPITGKEDIAKEIGLDVTAFSKCLNDGTFTQLVIDSLTDGEKAGVSGTPTGVVLIKYGDDYKVLTSQVNFASYDNVKKVLDQALYISDVISK